MKISVVILNYNGRDFVAKCVDAVLGSDFKNLEVVVVDNGSEDGSGENLKREYKNNRKVKVYRLEKNDYLTGGFGFGVKKAKGEKILILSNDVVVEKNCISRLYEFCKKDRKILVQPKVLFYDQRDVFDNVGGYYRFGVGRVKGRGEKDRGQYDEDKRVDFVATAGFMMDRVFFEELGGYDEWFKYYYEDVDLCLRAKRQGGQFWYCHQAVVYHKHEYTVKRYAKKASLVFHVRKNMVWTVINNFRGVELFCRLAVIWFLLFLITLRDLVNLRLEQVLMSVRSQIAVWKKFRTGQPWIRSHL